MANGNGLSLGDAQRALAMAELQKGDELSRRYGLALTEAEMALVVRRRFDALERTGRVELGEGVTGKLVFAFCDSPYIQRDEWLATLLALQDDFYEFKNDAEGEMSDDELIEGMRRVFNGKAKGSLEYLESMSVGDLNRAWRGMEPEDGGEEGEYDGL